ncbi:MAG: M1 family metallopeptidase [Limisphaerales bacterium]
MKYKLTAVVVLTSLFAINSQFSASAQFSPGSRSAGDPYLPAIGNGGYDVQHYDLTINYNPAANTMVSKADITILATQGLSEFSLDLRGFPGATTTIDGIAAGVARVGDKLIITPMAGILSNRVFHAVINYSGTPAEIVDPDGSSEGWVPITGGGFVVNEPMGAMGWFPCNNAPSDKATYDFHITVPNTHTALGNGELASKVNNGDGTTTWNWHMGVPMATYLSTATVGMFDYTKTFSATNLGVSGNPLEIYNAFESALSASQKSAAATAAGRQDGIIKFIADEIGAPYPYDSTGVVLHRTSLGYTLEVQTKTHFSGTSIGLTTLAHETTHQWFGDNVSPATWREIWFNEGFATWWEWYWGNQQNGGTTTVQQRFTSNYNSTSQPTRWNTPPANLPDASAMFSTFPVYTRPAMMLEAYRQIVGNSTFFAFQRALISEHAYSTISGSQFIALAKRVAQERSGFEASYLAKLDEFFQQWLYGVGKPTLTPATFFLNLPPRLALRFISASQLEIAWPSTTDPYLLEETGDLRSTSWNTVPQSQTVTNGETKVTLVPPAGNHFYRLRKN